jgi:hypothetical protein
MVIIDVDRGASRNNPRICSRVVLPQPEGPRIKVFLPRGITRFDFDKSTDGVFASGY